MRYWLFKNEPDHYSYSDLAAERDCPVMWQKHVRNHQAKNFIKEIELGDIVVVYHSSTKIPAAIGLAEVKSAPYPDPAQFSSGHKYEDPKSSVDDPRWWTVDVEAIRELERPVSISEFRADEVLQETKLVKNSRLSISPLTKDQYNRVLVLSSS
jgi:predicted RNA-binding protein with PUA-like domain